MSISATDAITGPVDEFDQEKYRSHTYKGERPYPSEKELQVNQPLSHRVQEIEQGKSSNYHIDSCITVTGPSRAFRAYQANLWTDEKKSAANNVYLGVGTVVLSIVGTVIGVVAEQPIGAVIGVVALVTSAVFAAIAGQKRCKADEEIGKWNQSPENAVAERRRLAYQKGFPYAYTHNLKHANELHQNEIEHLYESHFSKFCEELLRRVPDNAVSKEEWIKDFVHHNPLDPSLKEYGMNKDQPAPELDKLSKEFVEFSSAVHDLRNAFNGARSLCESNARKLIDAENKIRNLELQPHARLRDLEIAAAQQKLDRFSKTSDAYKTAKDAFDMLRDAANEEYARRCKPIDKLHDKAIRKIVGERDAEIAKIDGNQSQNIANRYAAAREFLEKSAKAWREYKNPPAAPVAVDTTQEVAV